MKFRKVFHGILFNIFSTVIMLKFELKMDSMYSNIKVIAFDADDTLWVNEPYFREVEHQFCNFLSSYETENKINHELLKKELENLGLYGYGVKSFVLSLIETAIELSNGRINAHDINKIIGFGKNMLTKPIELLDGVEEVYVVK
jgi:putative hydrolase of the HAD superfamily